MGMWWRHSLMGCLSHLALRAWERSEERIATVHFFIDLKICESLCNSFFCTQFRLFSSPQLSLRPCESFYKNTGNAPNMQPLSQRREDCSRLPRVCCRTVLFSFPVLQVIKIQQWWLFLKNKSLGNNFYSTKLILRVLALATASWNWYSVWPVRRVGFLTAMNLHQCAGRMRLEWELSLNFSYCSNTSRFKKQNTFYILR